MDGFRLFEDDTTVQYAASKPSSTNTLGQRTRLRFHLNASQLPSSCLRSRHPPSCAESEFVAAGSTISRNIPHQTDGRLQGDVVRLHAIFRSIQKRLPVSFNMDGFKHYRKMTTFLTTLSTESSPLLRPNSARHDVTNFTSKPASHLLLCSTNGGQQCTHRNHIFTIQTQS